MSAARTEPSQKYGFVFLDCTLTGDGDAQAYLGRPWQWDRGRKAAVAFVRTKMGPHIRPGDAELAEAVEAIRKRKAKEIVWDFSAVNPDGETGLWNSRHFVDALTQEIERSRTYNRPVALACPAASRIS